MATQADRRAATRAAILKKARDLFGSQGFAATTMDQIATGASVAKGAVYHHFPTKEALFEAVFGLVAAHVAEEVLAASRAEKTETDGLAALVAGTRSYFTACSNGPAAQIILRDGPAVLGWERWRQLDAEHFCGMIPKALAAAMDAGLIARQPVDPLARLLMGAITEAAAACAGRPDLAEAGAEYGAALASMIEAMRVKQDPGAAGTVRESVR